MTWWQDIIASIWRIVYIFGISFIHSIKNDLLNTCHMPGTLVNTEDMLGTKNRQSPSPYNMYNLIDEADVK